MNVRTTVVCLPVRDLDRTLAFYRGALGFADAQADEGTIVLELPNLSLFLMEKTAFEMYTKKAGLDARFPDNGAGIVISCAMETRQEIDTILQNVPQFGGAAAAPAGMDQTSGGYTGYLTDPDGHVWELVYPQQG